MTLRAALIQTDICNGEPAVNRAAAERAACDAAADLLIFPEMFTTGFMVDTPPSERAEEASDWIASLSARCGKALAGSMALRERSPRSGGGDIFVNRFFFAEPEGGVVTYDKRHLFAPGGEAGMFVPGDDHIVITWRGVRFFPIICYDLRFPVWCRCRNDYDVMICCASWPESRRMAWDTLLRARAIENQCYALGINRVGCDSTALYDGGTAAIDFKGHTMAAARDGASETIVAELDMEALRDFRERFPAWRDADGFEIKYFRP